MRRMIDIQRSTVVETTRRFDVRINGDQLRELLKSAGVLVPPGAEITFTVPGGGDWSNMSIDIDDEHPITVSWKTTEVK